MKNLQWVMLLFLGVLFCFSSCSKESAVDSPAERPLDVEVVSDYDKTFIIKWPEFSADVDQIRLRYTDGSDKKEVFVTDFIKDLIIEMENSAGEVDFLIQSVSKSGQLSEAVRKTVTQKGAYLDIVLATLTARAEDTDVVLQWANVAERPLRFTISYDAEVVEREVVIQTSDASRSYSFNGKYGKEVNITVTDDNNRSVTKSFSYLFTKDEYDLISSADKSGWSVSVSSNEPLEGRYTDLIDGIVSESSFWHTNWSNRGPNDYFPYHATITFDKVEQVTQMMLNLRSGTFLPGRIGEPGDMDIYTSTDGVNFNKVESLVNTQHASGAQVKFNLTAPLKTKYFRLVFKNNGSGLDFISLSEISFRVGSDDGVLIIGV